MPPPPLWGGGITVTTLVGRLQGGVKVHSFGTVRRAQAQACLSTGARLTVVLLTFSVLVQGGAKWCRSAGVARVGCWWATGGGAGYLDGGVFGPVWAV